MKFRTRLTLQFSVVVSFILIIFSFIIYSLLSEFRNDEFNERLKDQGLNTVKLLSDVDEVSPELLKIIDLNTARSLPNEKVFVYTINNKLVYCSLPIDKDEIPHNYLNKIKHDSEIQFDLDSTEFFGFLYRGRYDDYLVVAGADDLFGNSKLNYLRNILISGDIVAILLIMVIGLVFARQALVPLAKVVNEIDNININNLGVRIEESKTKDELSMLAVRFNRMLERLDQAFETQRSFVANASHELRTPLTSLTGQLEVTLMNKEINEEGREVLKALLNEIKQLNKLSNGLLELAQANLAISDIAMANVRIDELIGLAHSTLLKRNKDYSVEILFNDLPEESWLTIYGNEQLLSAALANVFDNACKYSNNHHCTLSLTFDENKLILTIKDNGIGISEKELPHIFEAFYRAEEVKNTSGHGIGLALTKKIVEIHHGDISVNSTAGIGTTVTISLPHIR